MKNVLTILVITFSLWGYSQNYQTNLINVGESDSYPSDWVNYTTSEYFRIDYKFVDCDPSIGYDAQYIILRISNLSQKPLQIRWNMELYYGDVCKTCGYTDEYGYNIEIEPGQNIEGDCSFESNYQLKIFSKFIDKQYKGGAAPLTAFQLNSLTLS